MATNLRRPEAQYTFTRCAGQDGFHALRAPTWTTVNRGSLDAQQFQGEIAGWLAENAEGEWHVGRVPFVHGYRAMPQAFATGSALCVLVRKQADLDRFAQAFAVKGHA